MLCRLNLIIAHWYRTCINETLKLSIHLCVRVRACAASVNPFSTVLVQHQRINSASASAVVDTRNYNSTELIEDADASTDTDAQVDTLLKH